MINQVVAHGLHVLHNVLLKYLRVLCWGKYLFNLVFFQLLYYCISYFCIFAFPTSVFTTTSHLHAQQSSATTWSAAYLSDNLLQGLLSRGTPPGPGPSADLGEPAVWPTF